MRPSAPVRHFWPLRNHRSFSCFLRSALLVERLGIETRLTPWAWAQASLQVPLLGLYTRLRQEAGAAFDATSDFLDEAFGLADNATCDIEQSCVALLQSLLAG